MTESCGRSRPGGARGSRCETSKGIERVSPGLPARPALFSCDARRSAAAHDGVVVGGVEEEVIVAVSGEQVALPVVEGAKSRPVTAQYPQVSDVIRSNMNAYLAGTKTTDVALSDMKTRLAPILR